MGTLSVGSAAIFGQGIALLAYTTIGRSTGPAIYGVIMATLGIVGWLVAMTDLGSSSYMARELAKDRMDTNDYWGRVLSECSIIVGAGAVACLVVPRIWPEITLGFLALLFSWALARVVGLASGAYFRGLGAWRWSLGTGAIEPITILISALIVEQLHAGTILTAMLCLTLGAGASAAVGLVRSLRRFPPKKLRYRSPWRGSRDFTLISVMIAVSGLDVTLTGAVSGATAAGDYASAKRLSTPIPLAAAAVNTTTSRLAGQARSGLEAARQIRTTWPALALATLAGVVLFATAPLVVSVLLGPEFSGAELPLRITAIAFTINAFNTVAQNALQLRERARGVSISLTIGNVVMVVMIIILAPALGGTGAALAYLGLQVSFSICVTVIFFRARQASWAHWFRAALKGK